MSDDSRAEMDGPSAFALISQSSKMAGAQLGVSAAEAVAELLAYATGHKRGVLGVAADVTAGLLRFDAPAA